MGVTAESPALVEARAQIVAGRLKAASLLPFVRPKAESDHEAHVAIGTALEEAAEATTKQKEIAAHFLAIEDKGARDAALVTVNKVMRARLALEGDVDQLDPAGRLKFATGLGAIARGERPAPRQIVDGLIIENKIHWFAGHPGHGKSTMAMYVAVEHMAAGGHVIWLDYEAGEVPTVERLMAVGAKVAQVDDENPDHLFHLVVSPTGGVEPEDFAPVADALEEYPGALVVFDSASKALGAAGLDENNPTEATKWTTNIVIPAREAGATVIVIDHVVKGATKQTPYARGAGSKLADTDVSWFVEAPEPFDRETVGKVELTRKKDREGRLPERLIYSVGDGAGMLPVKQLAAEDEDTRDERNAGLRGNVLAVLQEHSTPERPLTGNQVVQFAKSRKAAVLEALGELGGMEGSGVHMRPGANRSIDYWYDPATRRDFEAMT